jgi:hypothetical protein
MQCFMGKQILKVVGMCLAFSLMCFGAYSQDLIIKKNGEEVVGKVVKMADDTIHYRMLSDANGPLYYVLRQEVAQVQLATEPGQKQLSQLPQVAPVPIDYASTSTGRAANTAGSSYNANELVYRGRQDALMYYKGQGPMWGTAGATFLFPPAGLVTGIVMASVRPNIDATFNPNMQLMQEPVYREAFQKQAHRRKIGKAAAGFGIGMGGLVILGLMLGVQ